MANITIDTWKATTIGLVLLIAAAGVTAFVVSHKTPDKSLKEAPKMAAAEHRPTQAEIERCNEYAASQAGSKGGDVAKGAGIGGLAGAGAGAAGGAIADGGSGAGKGAAIGGLVGVVGGALYGLNESKRHDARYKNAYAACMHSHGYE
jgi:hypothetical protein